MSCEIFRTTKEYNQILTLTDNNQTIADAIGALSDGNIKFLNTREEVFKELEYLNEKVALKKLEFKKSKESLAKLNPSFVFTYREREEVLNSLLYLVSIDPKTGDLRDVEDIQKALNPKNLKSSLEELKKAKPENSDNYDKLLQDHVLNAFIGLAREELRTLDPILEEDMEEDEKSSGSNFRDGTEVDEIAKASTAAKLLLRFLPTGKNSKTLGLPTYHNFKKNEKLILESLKDNPYSDEKRVAEILNRLDTLSIKHPQFLGLATKFKKSLTSDAPFEDKSIVQFLRTYEKHFEVYSTSFITETEEGYTTVIGSSDSASPSKIVQELWEDSFNTLFYSEDSQTGKIIFNKDRAQKLINKVNALDEVTRKLPTIPPTHINNLQEVFAEIGMELDLGLLDSYVNTSSNPKARALELIKILRYLTASTSASTNSLTELIKITDFGNSNGVVSLRNPIEDNSTSLKFLSELQAEFNGDITSSTIYAGGKMFQQFTLHNFLTLVTNDLNLGKDSTHLEKVKQDLFTTNSAWRKEIEDGKQIELELFNTITIEGANTSDSKDISEEDELLDRIERIYSNRFPLFTLADKSRVYYLKGFDVLKNTMVTKGMVEQFAGYFYDELNTMRKAYDELYGANPISKATQIENYHTGKKEGERGNVFTSTIFPELSPGGRLTKELEAQGIKIYKSAEESGKPFSLEESSFEVSPNGELKFTQGLSDKLHDTIKSLLEEKIQQNKTLLLENDKILRVSSTVLADYKTKDKDILAQNVATVFTINSLIGNIEQTKLFTGDPRMYKTIEDFLKRTPAVAATGDKLLVGKNVRKTFNIAVIKGFIKSSEIYTNAAYIENLMEFSGDTEGVAKSLNLVEYDPEVHSELTPFMANKRQWVELPGKPNPFSKINSTDGQAWISLARAKEIISGLNGWSSKLETAYQNIKNGRATKEDYKVFTKAYSLQPKKGMHYELVSHNGLRVPVHLKYSQAILFPELVKGNEELTRLVELMGDTIDEVIVTDGIKVGAMGVSDVTDPNARLNPITLSNNFWKLQQDLTEDGLKDKLVLSQPKKNMIADIASDEEYAPGYLGKDLRRDLHTVDSELSNIGTNKLKNEIYTNGVIDESKVRLKLIKDLKKENASQDVIQALEEGIALDALPNYRRTFMTKITNWYTKNAAKTKQLGGSAIQLSDLGFRAPNGRTRRIDTLSEIEQNSVIWLKEDGQDLLPPRVDRDEDGNLVMRPGQVLLNYKFIEALPQDIRNNPTKLKAAIDDELLRIVASRAPTQKLSFNTSIEVVGFLPPHVGDTIVAYKEGITTTGYDFDIDKLYFMLPNYKLSRDKRRLEYVRYLDESSLIEERIEALIKDPIRLQSVLEEAFGDTESAQLVTDNVRELTKNYRNLWKQLKDKEEDPTATEEDLRPILEAIENQFTENKGLIKQLRPFIGSLPIEKQNTKKALENRRIELYRLVLESPKSTVKILSAVDNEWLKIFIDTILPPKKIGNLDLYDGMFQMEKRREFLSSKGGVGQNANHLGDHALSQNAGIFLKEFIGIGNQTPEGWVDLSQSYTTNFEKFNPKTRRITEAENALITEILSVYMNAFVDAAKDNFIGRANFNLTTNNVAFTLMRAGISPLFVTAFLAQPIIQEYVQEVSNNRGLRGRKRTNKELLKELAKKYGSIDGLNTDPGTLETFTTNDLISMITSPKLELKQKLDQVELLSIFISKLEPMAKDLRLSMDASKADREGGGANLIDARLRRNALDRVANSRVGNFQNKFNSEDDFRTMLGAATVNTIDSVLADTQNLFIETTPGFNYLLNEIHSRALGDSALDMEKANKISKLIYGTLMNQFSSFSARDSKGELSEEEYLKLISGKNSLARRLKQLKDSGYGEINEFIDYLTYNINFSDKSPSFISVNNTKVITPKVSEMLTYSWLELYWSNNDTLRKFAIDAAKYSFYSSLFADNISSFYRLLPYPISRELGATTEVSAKMRSYLSGHNFSKYEGLIDNVLRNLVTDPLFTAKTPAKADILSKFKPAFKAKEFNEMRKLIPPTLVKILDPNIATNIIASTTSNNEVIYKPYIRSKRKIVTNTGSTYFVEEYYKYKGTIRSSADKSYPVYVKTNKLGYKRGKYQLYEISFDAIPKSVIKSNNIEITDISRQDISSLLKTFVEVPVLQSEMDAPYLNEIAEDIQTDITNMSEEALGFGQESNLPTSKETINIYAGTGENAELSNFANRPFIVGDDIFNTVEGAFQAAKLAYTSNFLATGKMNVLETEIFNKLKAASGATAKKLGRQIKDLDINAWDKISSNRMYTLLKKSFEQNPDALTKLIATSNATLTHTQDKGKWGIEFPRLLMRVREELKSTQSSNLLLQSVTAEENLSAQINNLYTQFQSELTKEGVSLEDITQLVEEFGIEEATEKIKKCYL